MRPPRPGITAVFRKCAKGTPGTSSYPDQARCPLGSSSPLTSKVGGLPSLTDFPETLRFLHLFLVLHLQRFQPQLVPSPVSAAVAVTFHHCPALLPHHSFHGALPSAGDSVICCLLPAKNPYRRRTLPGIHTLHTLIPTYLSS